MSTFHAGPVRRSCIAKFSGPDAGGGGHLSPDTCNLSSWLPSYLRAQGRVGMRKAEEDLEPNSRHPRRSQAFLRVPQFASLSWLLVEPASPHQFFSPCLPSMRALPEVFSHCTPLQDTPVLPPMRPFRASSSLPSQCSQTALCLPPGGMHTPSVLAMWPLPSV